MQRSLYERGLLRPDELAKLQRVFDDACLKRTIDPASENARELALTLLALHNAGMVDEEMLTAAVAYPRQMAKTA